MNIISIYTKEDFIKKDDKIIILEICEESSDKVEREEVEGDHIRIEYDSVNLCTITQIYYDKSKEKFMKIISTADSKVTVCVIPTDEELMIATDTMELL